MSTVHGNLFAPVGNTVSANASDATGSTQVNITDHPMTGGGSVLIVNDGPDTVFIRFGDSTVTATTTTGFPMAKGMKTFSFGPRSTNAAVVCEAGETARVHFSPGRGL